MIVQDSVSKEMSKRGFSSKSAEWSRSKKFSDLKIDINFVPLKNQTRKTHEPVAVKKPRQLANSKSPQIRTLAPPKLKFFLRGNDFQILPQEIPKSSFL